MVRRKVEIKKIEDKAKRHTTFTKRRQGLFKKAKDLSDRSGDQIAVIAFSLAGNVYAFGSPSVDSIVHRYHNIETHTQVAPETQEEEDDDDDVAEEEEVDDVADEVVVVKEELDELEAAVECMRKKVSALAKHMIKKIM